MGDRRIALALLALGGVFGGACAARPDASPDYVVAEGNLAGSQDGESAPSQGETSEVVVEEEERPATSDELEDWDPGDGKAVPEADGGAVADASAPNEDAGAPTTVTKSQTCTSKYGRHKSVSKLTWTVTGGTKLKIKAFTVQVFNSHNRSKNDVDVWANPPGSYERKAFNSGDVLADNKLTTVRWAYSLYPKEKEVFRIETNFDQEGGDPSASCSITVQR